MDEALNLNTESALYFAEKNQEIQNFIIIFQEIDLNL
jgi:hypothetical protein